MIQLFARRIPLLSSILQEIAKPLLTTYKGREFPDFLFNVDTFPIDLPLQRARIPHFKLPPILGASDEDSCALPRIVCVTFVRNGKTVSTICLLVTGSSCTYIAGDV